MKHYIRISDTETWMSTISRIHEMELKTGDRIIIDFAKLKVEEIHPHHIVSLMCLLQFLQDSGIGFSIKQKFTEQWYADSIFGLWKVDQSTSSTFSDNIYRRLQTLYPDKELTAIKMGLNEIIYNIFDHSGAENNAFIYTRYNYHTRTIIIAACDFGIGIARLVRRYCPEVSDDAKAIIKAMEFAFTTKSRPHNGGFGLDNIIASCSDEDTFSIISNCGQIIVNNNIITTFVNDYHFPGTLIYYEVSLSKLPDTDESDDRNVHF